MDGEGEERERDGQEGGGEAIRKHKARKQNVQDGKN